MSDKGKVLGIDYGNAHTGIAMSDFDQNIAFGRIAIHNRKDKDVISQLQKICSDEKVVEIVVGLPLSLEGEKTEQTLRVERFVAMLKEALPQPVQYQDERLTTAESNVILTSINLNGKQIKKEKDIVAASIILQNYLDKKGKERQ